MQHFNRGQKINPRTILLIIALLFSIDLYSQKNNHNFFSDIHSVPSSDSTIQYFYLYKIPVNSLIFSKTNDSYSASVQVAIELSDSNSNFIQRSFKDRKIVFNDFALTSDLNNFVEGVIKFTSVNKTIIVTSTIFDANSQKQIFTKEQTVQKLINEDSEFFTEIILSSKIFKCGENSSRVLPNFSGLIPFDNNLYDILIPCTDTTLVKLYVKVISQKDTVFDGSIERKEVDRLGLTECADRIIISPDSASPLTSNFYITQISQKLKEGQIEIIVSKSEKFIKKRSFKLVARWLNKPRSLSDPESAIKLLRFIINDDSIKQILKGGDKYDSLLNKYWKKIDPSPTTEYNELMAEYYERIDFTIKNFSTITGQSGVETDRAKIYILYGKPTFIERSSNADDKISEIWIYSKPKKKFIFVDEKGIGEFILKNNL